MFPIIGEKGASMSATQPNDSNALNALDYISRREAIDAISSYISSFSAIDRNYYEGLRDAKMLLDSTPSAQSEPRWIPVTERLPEKREEVLVTVAGEIAIAWLYINGRWRSNDCPEAYLNDHITAWRELPEPYREATEDAEIQ